MSDHYPVEVELKSLSDSSVGDAGNLHHTDLFQCAKLIHRL